MAQRPDCFIDCLGRFVLPVYAADSSCGELVHLNLRAHFWICLGLLFKLRRENPIVCGTGSGY
jgi:hypothetical protein